jgi:hypothetical protein
LYTAVKDRARQHPQDYSHWYIDGGEPLEGIAHEPGLTVMSYPMVVPAAKREFALLKRLTSGTGAKGSLTSEAVGSYIAGLRPEDLNLEENSSEAPLRHFEVNLITQPQDVRYSAPPLFSEPRASACIVRSRSPCSHALQHASATRRWNSCSIETRFNSLGTPKVLSSMPTWVPITPGSTSPVFQAQTSLAFWSGSKISTSRVPSLRHSRRHYVFSTYRVRQVLQQMA